jgi:hypothetical protein
VSTQLRGFLRVKSFVHTPSNLNVIEKWDEQGARSVIQGKSKKPLSITLGLTRLITSEWFRGTDIVQGIFEIDSGTSINIQRSRRIEIGYAAV